MPAAAQWAGMNNDQARPMSWSRDDRTSPWLSQQQSLLAFILDGEPSRPAFSQSQHRHYRFWWADRPPSMPVSLYRADFYRENAGWTAIVGEGCSWRDNPAS